MLLSRALILIVVAFVAIIPHKSYGEVIRTKKSEKIFGAWKVLCERDVMIETSHCKIATKFFDNIATITTQPSSKMLGQMTIIIPNLQIGSFVKIKVGKNNVFFSNQVLRKDFSLVSLSAEQKSAILGQMKNSDFLFIRFTLSGSHKETTVQIDLKDFQKALVYYDKTSN
jgi:hypothetical protein